jgi:hypothetical protein
MSAAAGITFICLCKTAVLLISAGGIMEEMQGLMEQASAVMQEDLNSQLESVSLMGADMCLEDSQPTQEVKVSSFCTNTFLAG